MAQFGHLVSGAAWNISGKVVQLSISLVSLGVIARLVGPEAYGIFALGWLVVGLFEIVVSGAPTDTLVQRKEVSAGHFNATFVAALGLALLAAAAVWYCAATISGWLNGGEVLAAILPLRAAVLPLQAMAVVPTAKLMRVSRFKALASAETFASVVSNLVGLGMALGGAGIWSLVGVELARALVSAGTIFFLARWRPGRRMRATDFTDLLAFSTSTWAAWSLGYLNSQLPRLLIASTLGAHAVGVFALGQRLYDQVTNILMIPAYQVVQAGIARAQDDIGHARRLAQGTLGVTGVLACPLFLGLAALAPILVPTVFGEAWSEAIPVVQILMLLGVQASMSIVQAAVVRGMGKPHWDMVSAMVVVVITAGLLTVALPYGIEAVALAVVLSTLAIWPLDALFVRRLTGLPVAAQAATVGRAGLCAAVMAVCVWVLFPMLLAHVPAPVALIVLVGAGAVLYWAMLRILMPVAAGIIERVVLALARRDFGAIRASLGTLAP